VGFSWSPKIKNPLFVRATEKLLEIRILIFGGFSITTENKETTEIQLFFCYKNSLISTPAGENKLYFMYQQENLIISGFWLPKGAQILVVLVENPPQSTYT
jgi:hypothetical protein